MSYFPCDIPFMSDDELKENGIHIPKNVSDTNVGNVEYISREDAVNAVPEELKVDFMDEFGAGFNSCRNEMLRTVEALPPADVAPVVHSRWVKTEDGAKCEICGREAVYQIVDGHWEYEPWCPHCGAIMDNKKGNENG